MKTTWFSVVAISVGLLVAEIPLWAHHSFAAEFDAEKPVVLVGTVTIVAWTNPHAHIHVDVPDQAGNVASWDLELGSPNALKRRGWSMNALKVGDKITVNGYPAKDGTHLANARSMTMSDGRTLFAGSSSETAPQQ
jgi:hypothetical protein